MSTVTAVHARAMEAAEAAHVALLLGNHDDFLRLTRLAMELESEAASVLFGRLDAEPSRGILYRSAATLAVKCGEYRIAERMACTGLAGDPPNDIAAELRAVYEDATFAKHLDARGVELDQNDLQVSLAGPAVAHGFTQAHPFLKRLAALRKLIDRTADRLARKPYQDTGRIHSEFQTYLSVPRAASFAITVRLGQDGGQTDIRSTLLMTELVDCFELFESDRDRLESQIPNDAYRRNFAALATEIAPDGRDINLVGLTTNLRGRERRVALRTHGHQATTSGQRRKSSEPTRVAGKLLWADGISAKKKVKLVLDDESKTLTINVPEGLMEDVVKPYYGQQVIVTRERRDRKWWLESIEPADEE